MPADRPRQVVSGEIAPTAAKHIARVSGESRFLLAWATLDHDLTVREVRAAASRINDGEGVDVALDAEGVDLGRMSVSLPPDAYRELRRRAALEDSDPGTVIAEALETDR